MQKEELNTKSPNLKHWRALYVNSRAEKKVMDTLLKKDIEAYVPVIKTMRQWSDRKKMLEMPLLNGYVFVRCDEAQKDKVLQTKGVVGFVRSEGKIAIVRDLEIERLKQLVQLGYQLEVLAINKTYKQGDKVKITSGILKGIEGFVIESKENNQIDVLLESIGQSIRVKLPKELVLMS